MVSRFTLAGELRPKARFPGPLFVPHDSRLRVNCVEQYPAPGVEEGTHDSRLRVNCVKEQIKHSKFVMTHDSRLRVNCVHLQQ